MIRVNGRHLTGGEAATEVARASREGREISDACAQTIASWWQSPRDPGMTKLSSGMAVSQAEIAADIVTNYPLAETVSDRHALDMLGTWAINWRPASRVIHDDVRLCACCALKAANDDTSGCSDVSDPREHPLGVMGADFGGHVVVGDESDDFSQARCDGCGSELAGERFHAVVLS